LYNIVGPNGIESSLSHFLCKIKLKKE